MIKKLRKLDPNWKAELINFGNWVYYHDDKGLWIECRAGCNYDYDDSYYTTWYLKQNDKYLTESSSKFGVLNFLEKNFDNL